MVPPAGLYKCDNAVGSDIVGTDSLTWSKVCTGDGTTIKDTSGVLNVNHSLVLTSSLKVGSGSSGSFQGAVIQGISNTNGYAQVEVQNLSSGAYASTDFIATANNGTDSSNYVDLGINSSGYNSASWGVNGAGDAYLYSSDGGLAVGAAASGKKLSLFAGGSASSNIQAEVTSAGVNFTSGTTIVTGSLHSTVSLQTAGALVLTGGLGYNQIGSGSFAADRVVFASEIGIGSPSPVCYPSLYKRQSTAGASEGIDRVVNKIDLFESQQIAVGGTAFKAVYFNLHYSNMTFNVLAGDLNVAFIPHNGSTVMPAFAHTYFWSLYNVRQVVLTPLTSNFTTTLGGMTVTNPTAAVTSSIGSSVTPTSACYLSLTGSGATLPAELGISVGVWNGSATSVTGSLMVWGSACRHIITSSLS